MKTTSRTGNRTPMMDYVEIEMEMELLRSRARRQVQRMQRMRITNALYDTALLMNVVALLTALTFLPRTDIAEKQVNVDMLTLACFLHAFAFVVAWLWRRLNLLVSGACFVGMVFNSISVAVFVGMHYVGQRSAKDREFRLLDAMASLLLLFVRHGGGGAAAAGGGGAAAVNASAAVE